MAKKDGKPPANKVETPAPKRTRKRSNRRGKAMLVVRNAAIGDVDEIYNLGIKAYGKQGAMTKQMIRGQITKFPDGQFVVEYEGEVAGYCATFMIAEKIALAPHTWKEITGNGFASRHDPKGDYLYGMEVLVDPEKRGLRIGTRLYQKRVELCEEMGLKGIVFGGRIPGYAKKQKTIESPTEYIEKVRERKFRDPVVLFHFAHDYELLGVLKNYDPDDKESCGYAAHLIWRNPAMAEPITRDALPSAHHSGAVRVATVQFQMRRVESEEQFEHQLEYFVDVASDYGSDFVVFPEMVVLALLSATQKKMRPEEAIKHLTKYTKRYIEVMKNMAISYNINIIGGSLPTRMSDGDIHNVCYVFLRSGEVYAQEKLHPTPDERYWWNIKGGDTLEAIPTDCGPVGVLICYDTEFPETARHLVDQGAMIVFVPFCTDERQGYLRVRYCCQAMAVQNQCYVVMSGTVGNLPDVENLDINYAESCILTPCDFPFARDGIAAETPPNTETIAFADLHLDALNHSRHGGTVQNLRDRRFDLYNIDWRKG